MGSGSWGGRSNWTVTGRCWPVVLAGTFLDRGVSEVGSNRGGAERLPDGLYCVPDPDDRSRLTFWSVKAGTIRDWPVEARWRPVRPPYPPGLDRADRKTFTDEWYADCYFPWKDRLVDSIAADVQGSAARFEKERPNVVLPPASPPRPRVRRRPAAARVRETPFRARLFEERMIAAALRRSGKSFTEIGKAMGLPKATAVRRAQEGESMGNPATQDLVVAAMFQVRIGHLEDRLRSACRQSDDAGPGPVEEMLDQLGGLRSALGTSLGGDGR